MRVDEGIQGLDVLSSWQLSCVNTWRRIFGGRPNAPEDGALSFDFPGLSSRDLEPSSPPTCDASRFSSFRLSRGGVRYLYSYLKCLGTSAEAAKEPKV